LAMVTALAPYEPYIGIDLGTTYSCVGLWTEDGRVEIIHNERNSKTTPSVVAFEGQQKVTVGESAYDRAANHGAHLAFDIKRLIGRARGDP